MKYNEGELVRLVESANNELGDDIPLSMGSPLPLHHPDSGFGKNPGSGLDRPWGDLRDKSVEKPETSGDEFVPISVPASSKDFEMFRTVINKGIDSHLQGFTKSKFEMKKEQPFGSRFFINLHKSEIPIMVRRLQELGTDEADQWASDIEDIAEKY